jgi:signal transduction histidine kinase
MPPAVSHRVRPLLAWPALLSTVLLLILLLGGYAIIESRRLQQTLTRELEERALALIGVLEASSRNAIATQTMLEEIVGQRLLDNARFVDFIIARTPRAPEMIQRVAQENRLAKVELLDREGQPATLPQVEMPGPGSWAGGRGFGGPGRRGFAPREGDGETETGSSGLPHGPMMRGMMRGPEGGGPPAADRERPSGMPFMWGHRWGGLRGDPTQLFPSLPKNAPIRRFWEGSAFGVAVPAQSFPGVIVVHANAEYLLNFRREIGLQRLIEDLGKQPGIVEVSLLDGEFSVVASSDAPTVGRKEQNAFLRETLSGGAAKSRRQSCGDACEVVEVVKPFTLDEKQVGLIRLALSTAGLADVTRQAQRGILRYSLGLLAVGVAGTVAIFWIQARHLADRQRLEATVAHEQRLSAMGNLAAGVAHEIKNPLNAISMGLQRLRMEFAPAAPEVRQEYTQFTRIIEAEVLRLNTIVNQFLSLARPLRLTLGDEPLLPLLREILTLLSPQASAQEVKIVEELQAGDVRLPLDRQQLSQALMNVLLNALQAMPKGGTVTVRTRLVDAAIGQIGNSESLIAQSPNRHSTHLHALAAQQCVEVVVTDTGPGIPPEHLDRIFEPYFTTKDGGTGLGLALARRIIQEHQGSIRAENVPGGGARFVIDLPLA